MYVCTALAIAHLFIAVNFAHGEESIGHELTHTCQQLPNGDVYCPDPSGEPDGFVIPEDEVTVSPEPSPAVEIPPNEPQPSVVEEPPREIPENEPPPGAELEPMFDIPDEIWEELSDAIGDALDTMEVPSGEPEVMIDVDGQNPGSQEEVEEPRPLCCNENGSCVEVTLGDGEKCGD